MNDIFNLEVRVLARSVAVAAASVKVIAFLVTWLILWLPIAIPLAQKLKWNPIQPSTGEQKLPMLATLYLIAPTIVWAASWVEGASFSDYGLNLEPQIFISLGLGLTLSLLGLSLVFLLESLAGWVQWHRENFKRLWSFGLPILGLGLGIGLIEELIFRGFVLTELLQDYSLGVAAIASSLIFALSHLLWERKQTLPQLPGLMLMGVVLVLARWADRGSLGLAWGLHAGWIWGLTCLDAAALISYPDNSSAWIVGLGGQPLAGIAGILCLLGTGASLFWLF
jgi:uncharacterized protein